ncbi:MAG: hypothetical protein AAFQ09_10020 [Pseudomonadota bacterium]
MKKRRRTPQEKKALSYAKDRKNNYGENNKSSRKNIPLSKAKAIRSMRRGDKVKLNTAPLSDDLPLTRGKPRWQKVPDQAIGARLDYREHGSPGNDRLSYDFHREEARRVKKRIKAIGRPDKHSQDR